MSEKKQSNIVEIWTDGACSKNPGIGGWGAILKWKDKEKQISGGELKTTNNRMELISAISALETLKRPMNVIINTDSLYVKNGITKWIENWKKSNWKKVKNVDLWKLLDKQAKKHNIKWKWIKGHSGNYENEKCDNLAKNYIILLKNNCIIK